MMKINQKVSGIYGNRYTPYCSDYRRSTIRTNKYNSVTGICTYLYTIFTQKMLSTKLLIHKIAQLLISSSKE